VPPPPRIPDDIRADIADYIRAHAGTPQGTFRAISAHFGVAKSSIGVVADEYGLTDAWTEAAQRTDAATSARRTYLAAQRALLQEDYLDAAADLLTRLHDDVTYLHVVKTGFDESIERTVLPPGPAEWRSTMSAVAAANRAAVELAKLDNDDSATTATVSLLDQFAADLQADRAQREQQPSETP
jgi:hypothetical protein